AYVEGVDDIAAALDERDSVLPPLERGDRAKVVQHTPSAHKTTPPSRYTEALLVKRLEELGIGRPSTYATIIETITSREYAIAPMRSIRAASARSRSGTTSASPSSRASAATDRTCSGRISARRSRPRSRPTN